MVDLPSFGSSPEAVLEPRLREYREILSQAWTDGFYSTEEAHEVADARQRLNITGAEHERLLKQVRLTPQQVPELRYRGDKESVEALMFGLSSADAELQTACLQALRTMKLKQIKAPLLASLEDADPYARRGALEVIAARPFKDAKDKVIEAMEDTNKFVRRSATAALASLIHKFHDSSAANMAVQALNDKDPVVRKHSVDGLRFMLEVEEGKYEGVVAQQLVEAIDDGNSFVRKHALDIFEQMGEAALDHIVERGLEDENFDTRRVALDALGRLNTNQSIPYLVEALKSEDRYLRWQAAKSLARFPDEPEAVEGLAEALGDEDPFVRRRAAKSLARHGEAALEQLLELTRYGLPRTQRNAWRALSLMSGFPELAQPFLRALKGEDPKVRRWAVLGLGRTNDWSEDVLYSLKRVAAEDQDPKVSQAAKASLSALDAQRMAAEASQAAEQMAQGAAPAPEELGEEALSSSGMV